MQSSFLHGTVPETLEDAESSPVAGIHQDLIGCLHHDVLEPRISLCDTACCSRARVFPVNAHCRSEGVAELVPRRQVVWERHHVEVASVHVISFRLLPQLLISLMATGGGDPAPTEEDGREEEQCGQPVRQLPAGERCFT